MDTKALEDLIALSVTGSFSKAAEKRFVTQPAFSRRIKSLENWFGTDLVDRSHYPTKLTPEGEEVLKIATTIVDELYRCKQDVRMLASGDSEQLRFAMPHSLSIGFFPQWRAEIEEHVGKTNVNVITGNIHDTAQMLDSGSCDFVIFYSFDLTPSYNFSDPKFNRVYVGNDFLIPVCAPDSKGVASTNLDTGSTDLFPYLAWSPPTLVNHVLTELFRINELDSRLQVCYQNQLAAALREEALLGRGLAWLPGSLINDDLASGRLIRASSCLDVPMKIGIACNSKNLTANAINWWEQTEANGPS